MYLYLFVDDSKEYIKEQYVLKKGFSNMIDFRENQLIKEYNVKLYLLGLYEIKNDNYEKIYHKFNAKKLIFSSLSIWFVFKYVEFIPDSSINSKSNFFKYVVNI